MSPIPILYRCCLTRVLLKAPVSVVPCASFIRCTEWFGAEVGLCRGRSRSRSSAESLLPPLGGLPAQGSDREAAGQEVVASILSLIELLHKQVTISSSSCSLYGLVALSVGNAFFETYRIFNVHVLRMSRETSGVLSDDYRVQI